MTATNEEILKVLDRVVADVRRHVERGGKVSRRTLVETRLLSDLLEERAKGSNGSC